MTERSNRTRSPSRAMSPISETARERHLGAQVSSDLSRIHRDFAPDDPRWRCGEDKTGCR